MIDIRQKNFQRRQPFDGRALLADALGGRHRRIVAGNDLAQLATNEAARIGPERNALAAARFGHWAKTQKVGGGVGENRVLEFLIHVLARIRVAALAEARHGAGKLFSRCPEGGDARRDMYFERRPHKLVVRARLSGRRGRPKRSKRERPEQHTKRRCSHANSVHNPMT